MTKRRVCFLIPASPTRGFMSQIAAFELALKRLNWNRWEANTLVCFGEDMDEDGCQAYGAWQRHMRDVTIVFAPRGTPNEYYYNQIDGLYRWAPKDADVLVRVDADTLPVSNIERMLELVLQKSAIAGTIAHYRFPFTAAVGNRESWLALAEPFVQTPLRFRYSYSLASVDLPEDDRATPYYLNDGCVFFSRRYFDQFAPLYLDTRPKLMTKLRDPYFAGQVALALSVARIGLPAIALPLRYNFPNDEIASVRYPEEMENAKIIHYLRTKEFDRQQIFQSAEGYAEFLTKRLNKPNSRFRDYVRSLFGDTYPFGEPTIAPRPLNPQANLEKPSTTPSFAAEEEFIAQFRKCYALEPLMKAKQSLVAKLGIECGYTKYRELLSIPEQVRINHRTLIGQSDYARKWGKQFVETSKGGKLFRIKPIKVVGEGHCSEFVSVSRPTHVACIADAIVRGSSALIESGYHALLEFHDEELDLFDCEFEIDPAIFHGERHSAWVISGAHDPACLEVEEAFTLLGPQLGAFGDFMMQYLPRYVWADMSGALPRVPILVSSNIAPTIEQAIRLVLPENIEMIKVEPLQPVRVRRLWCASNLTYAPGREVMDERYSPDHTFPAPDLMTPVVRELKRRVAPHIVQGNGKNKVYLARRPNRWRSIVNATEIEAIAKEEGFQVVYPEELDYIGQINLLANADHVIAPQGSALFLCYFARCGSKVCILQHTMVEGTNAYDAFFDGCDLKVLTGPIAQRDPLFPHRSSYSIDAKAFRNFLIKWGRSGSFLA